MKTMKYWRLGIFILVLTGVTAVWVFAQSQPKPGYVYVLSNIGSFGENMYKIGMTQRERPLDRVKELGDSSVPFAFDVHVLIATDDPRGLERKVQDDLKEHRVNKINHRKEFFRTDLDTIIAVIEKHHDQPIEVTREPQANEYRQTLEILQNLQMEKEKQ